MRAKEYLRQLKDIDDLITTNQEEADKYRALATSISVSYSDDIQGKGGTSDKVGNNAVLKAEYDVEINKLIDELYDIKLDASKMIAQIQPLKYRTILTKYYFQNKTFEQVAEELDKSRRWITELHGQALAKFSYIYDFWNN